MRPVRLLCTIALAAVLVPTLASPALAADLPVGESRGIRIVRENKAVTFVFTKPAAHLYKRIAGRLVMVECWVDLRYPYHDAGGVSAAFDAPRRGSKLRTGFRSASPDRWDYCRVWRAAYQVRRRNSTRFFSARWIASIPITQRGAVYLDERAKARALQGFLDDGDERPVGPVTHPTSQQLAGIVVEGRRIVALPTPDATPPKGTLGYYSDGGPHAVAAIVSAAGRRLFYEVDADEVVRTNVAYYLPPSSDT